MHAKSYLNQMMLTYVTELHIIRACEPPPPPPPPSYRARRNPQKAGPDRVKGYIQFCRIKGWGGAPPALQ